jgi:hypothetical protein
MTFVLGFFLFFVIISFSFRKNIFLFDTNRIRGRLGTILIFKLCLGILLGFILGDVMAFETIPLCLLMITNLFLAGVIFIHDSPIYLLRKSRFRVRSVVCDDKNVLGRRN